MLCLRHKPGLGSIAHIPVMDTFALSSQINLPPLQSAAGLTWVRALAWLSGFLPMRTAVNSRERRRAALGAAVGIFFSALAGHALVRLHPLDLWLVAPLGASAVLVFALPASPLAQPWAVIGGNTVSALVGVACVSLIPDPGAAAVAVALAVMAMFATRCLHPPGGATALLVVLNQVGNVGFALAPVALDSLLLVVAGILYNSLTGRPYPHRQAPPQDSQTPRSLRFSGADLDAALAHYNQVLDVSRDDLEDLLHHAETAAYQRSLGSLRCADIMSAGPRSVGRQTPLGQAHALMHANRIKSLPVTDGAGRVIGIVTAWDILERMANAPAPRSRLFERSRHRRPDGVVAEVMTHPVRTAGEDQAVLELVRLFSEGGHHHIPIVDCEQRLLGIITQSDLIRALYRAVRV